jgi:hypothetical protein
MQYNSILVVERCKLTTHPSKNEAQNLASDDGEVLGEQACEVAADGDRITGEVCDECGKCLVLQS